jgi:anti-sigma B factor antagonist
MINISNLPIFAGNMMQLPNPGDDPSYRKPTQTQVNETMQFETSPSRFGLFAWLRLSLRSGAWKQSLRLIFSKMSIPRQPSISTPAQMQITERMHGSVIVISICGPIDLGTSSQLRAYLQLKVAQRAKDIMLDFARVTRIESTGLATLLEFLRSVQRFKGHLVLATLSSRVQSAFEIMRLKQVFSIYSDQTTALIALKLMREETSLLGGGARVATMSAKVNGVRHGLIRCLVQSCGFFQAKTVPDPPKRIGSRKLSFMLGGCPYNTRVKPWS